MCGLPALGWASVQALASQFRLFHPGRVVLCWRRAVDREDRLTPAKKIPEPLPHPYTVAP